MKDDKPHKIAQVIMLPTKNELWKVNDEHADRFEFLFYDIKKKILYSRNSNALNWSISHLYIISDEEIKEGDWYYNSSSKTIHQSNGIEIFDYRKDKQVNWKIIASTNSELKEENVLCNDIPLPRPSDDFLKAFVKAQGKIDKVLVEYFEQIPDWEDDLLTPEYETVLKVVRDNTITIKPIQKEKIDIVDLAEIELKSYVNPSEEFKDGFIDGVTIGYYHKNKEAIHTWIDKGIDVFSGKKTSWSREEERLQTLYYKLKVSPDNTITIRTVEGEKKDYSIEYLKFIATRFAHECRLKDVVSNHETCTLFDKWIKENL